MKTVTILLGILGLPLLGRSEETGVAGARRALEEGLPQVAIHRLKDIPASREASLLLAKALLAAGRAEEVDGALAACAPDDCEAHFWRAEALAALRRPQQALESYQKASASLDFAQSALLGQARALVALGRRAEALALLQNFPESLPASNRWFLEVARLQFDAGEYDEMAKTLARVDQPSAAERREVLYLSGRRALALAKTNEAEMAFAAIEKPDAVLAGQLCLAQAEAALLRDDAAGAEKLLEEFIENHPDHAGLAVIFEALDRLYVGQGEGSNTEFRRWADDRSEPGRAALALYYRARNESRLSREDRSRQLYADFIAAYPSHPLAGQARLALAQSCLRSGDAEGALNALKGGGEGGALDFLRGEALAVLGDFAEASARFLTAAETFEPERALYNAAFCAMRAGVPDPENAALARLGNLPGGDDWLRKFELAEALHLARNRDPRAEELLRQSWQETGSARAALALAEWAYVKGDPAEARRQIIRVSTQDPLLQERKEGLEIFLLDTGDSEAEAAVIEKAQAFLREHPDSAMEPEVRMKLGEMLFRRGDYLGARAQFDEVSQRFPDSPLAEKASFLSAQALSRSVDPQAMDESLELYEEVVKRGGPLALRARLEQALLQYALGRPREAVVVLDRILELNPDRDLRYTALNAKGNTLFSQGSEDPGNYRQAIAVWKEISNDPEAPLGWRNQALARAGAAYEKLGEPEAALDSYYQALDPGKSDEPEYFWFYQAGFDAGRLLESQQLWKEAIVVYEKVAAQEGPRAEEAKQRINQLRLENFLWE